MGGDEGCSGEGGSECYEGVDGLGLGLGLLFQGVSAAARQQSSSTSSHPFPCVEV